MIASAAITMPSCLALGEPKENMFGCHDSVPLMSDTLCFKLYCRQYRTDEFLSVSTQATRRRKNRRP
jgi:hypothetical protein